MQDYLKIANSGWMWFAVAVPMAVLAWQVFLLLRRSLRDGRRMGVKNEQIKSAVIASASASIGPSVSILTGMVSLMVMMGAPIAWMRLSYIGAVMFEMTSADVGAEAVGVAFEQSSMTAEAFANGVWAMILGSVGWIIVSGLFTHKIDGLRTRLAGGNQKALPIITAAATLALSYLRRSGNPLAGGAAFGFGVSIAVFAFSTCIAEAKERIWGRND